MKRPTLHRLRFNNEDLTGHLEQRIPDVSDSRFAELIGLRGIFVKQSADAGLRRGPGAGERDARIDPARKAMR